MKLIKSFKKKDFSLKKLRENTEKEKNHNASITNEDNFDSNDKLFFILNIGNYEYNKNKIYIIDEIEYKIENNENINDIAFFIKSFIKNSFGIVIDDTKLIDWINETYKYKLKAINKKHKNIKNSVN